MPTIATHSGPFHADDVFAVALLRRFWSRDATVVRTRDKARIAACDCVVDVGALYDPASLRFDHHQSTYEGQLSSAGMVLVWLRESATIPVELASHLCTSAVEYIDAVDTGRHAPKAGIPCFPRIIESLNALASTEEEFDGVFLRAVDLAGTWLDGMVVDHERVQASAAEVRAAMADADRKGTNLLEFPAYISWKPGYFANGGESHPTEFVLFPGTDATWRIIAIPPRDGEFGQKVSLPESWAGLTDASLEAVTGVPGSMFCHKNRFIAVFKTREGAVEGLRRSGLLRG